MLGRLGLIRQSADAASPPLAQLRSLPALCDAGALEGGLSVALDVRPDELIGPLASAIGGGGSELRVIEVRDEPRREMTVRLGSREKTWTVASLEALVHRLNELFQIDPAAKAVAILGECEGALQLWALDKRILPELLREDFFRPTNRKELARVAQVRTSC
jgi:hypothetical protein